MDFDCPHFEIDFEEKGRVYQAIPGTFQYALGIAEDYRTKNSLMYD
ncbi:MAG: hypothetical protein MZV70_17645 [Desulfobacterales bacterium]|nr:hypothetical protein [Desulfobacterales bacterium]